MGRQARLRAQRREEAQRASVAWTVPTEPMPSSPALNTLREVHYDIRRLTLLPALRCWELLVEMLAHHTGWKTDTNEDEYLWDLVPMPEQRFHRYAQEWNEEVTAAKLNNTTFSEPIGDLLMEIAPEREDLRQPPMSHVHESNRPFLDAARTMRDDEGKIIGGGLAAWCGTGRFALHSFVFNNDVQMFLIDPNPWLMRAAITNVRYLAQFSTRFLPNDDGDPIRRLGIKGDALIRNLERAGIPFTHTREDGIYVVGGRAWAVNAHPDIIDMGYLPNWQLGMLFWTLNPPWEHSLLIDQRKFDFYGTWAQYRRHLTETAARTRLRGRSPGVRYDFAMTAPP